jgi:hypothetical protein
MEEKTISKWTSDKGFRRPGNQEGQLATRKRKLVQHLTQPNWESFGEEVVAETLTLLVRRCIIEIQTTTHRVQIVTTFAGTARNCREMEE